MLAMSELVRPRLMLVALTLSLVVFALLLSALTFEFFIEEMAKVFVVPILVTAIFTSAGLIITLAVQSRSKSATF